MLGGQRATAPGVRDLTTNPADGANTSASEDSILSDVWLSDDGCSWRLAASNVPWGAPNLSAPPPPAASSNSEAPSGVVVEPLPGAG